MKIDELAVGAVVHWRGEPGRVVWLQPEADCLRGTPSGFLEAMRTEIAEIGTHGRTVQGAMIFDARARRVLVLLDRRDAIGLRFAWVLPPTLWRSPCDGPVGYEQIQGMLVRGEDRKVRWRCEVCGANGRTSRPRGGGRGRHERPVGGGR